VSAERLPLLVSVPHAGLAVPAALAPYCRLTPREIAEDGDEGAAEIYAFPDRVARHVTTDVARAILDMNRAEDDRGRDGVVKTHTCWDVPVYEPFPPEDLVQWLLAEHHRPYHAALSDDDPGLVLGVDCHTMAAHGPPVGPDPGAERPAACLSNGDGTCPDEWLAAMARHLERALGRPVTLNDPFRGGHIVRRHASERPWMQLELSRAPFLEPAEKRRAVLAALQGWCGEVAG
jgi:N-formylglutamate amidohydrolase